MNIAIAVVQRIPVITYGGTERVVWCLGRELKRLGHNVKFLAPESSERYFAPIIRLDAAAPLAPQIPEGTEFVHFFFDFEPQEIPVPYMITVEGNSVTYPNANMAFVSRDHARRHGSECYVYNGLDWDDYGPADLERPREYYHFLAKAAWRVKNLRGAIRTASKVRGGNRLVVMGGTRLNVKMGFRFTASPKVSFRGMVGQDEKARVMNRSKGLLFPVRWHEPFGLAIVESMWYGCPVFATPYGSLPELVPDDTGFLSADSGELARAMTDAAFSPARCHEYARDLFNSRTMAERYLEKYETVSNGRTLNAVPPRRCELEKNLAFG